MHFQFDVANANPTPPMPPPQAGDGLMLVTDLLRQLLDTQKEQLAHARATTAAPEARWRTLLMRWREEFPELPGACKQALPVLERAYGAIIASLVEELSDKEGDALDNDFSLQEFLDRYGMRLGQLGHLLNLVTPLAEIAAQSESSEQNPK